MPVEIINGHRLNYVQINSEQPGDQVEDLIMVHGLATNMAFWYFQYAPAFSKRYRITLYDLRGHGRSEMTESGYTPHNLATDLQSLLDHLGIKRAYFIVHSFGGIIALNLACIDPKYVAGLILADTHIYTFRQLQGEKSWEYGKKIQSLLHQYGLDLEIHNSKFGCELLTLMAQMQIEEKSIPENLAELIIPYSGKFSNRTAMQWLNLMTNTSAEKELMSEDGLTLEKLQKFNFPILSIYGENSQAKLTGKQLLDIWPNAEFRHVRGAGHFFLTSRSDEVLTICNQFLNGELTNNPKYRNGEDFKNYFRCERFFKSNGKWFFFTRESTRIGPFIELNEAKKFVGSYLSKIIINDR